MFSRDDLSKDDARGRAANAFVMKKWREMLAFYRQTVHQEIGCKAIGFVWDMTGNARYNSLRAELDLVMAHGYHAHPQMNGARLSFSQGSDIAASLKMFRTLNNMRIAGRPFCVNEYQAYFWNRYRYEEGFSAAYASFQGFDSLVRHNSPVNGTANSARIVPWISADDPIATVAMAQEALLYARGDAREADTGVRLVFSEQALRENNLWDEGLDGGQSRIALLTRFGLERTDLPQDVKPGKPADDIRIPMRLGSKVLEYEAGYAGTVETQQKGFEFSGFVRALKNRGALPTGNRSRDWETIESSTGELFVEAGKKRMTVNTPRFQGMCAPAGNLAELKDVTLENQTKNANLSVAALSPGTTIADADRLLVCYATNALNSGQMFTDSSMVQLQETGDHPTLVECGRFRITLRNLSAL
ncbi:MAG: hypothetical protein HPZ91_00690 [Lentisphaeria bacterium]|nr:hypothetical protein [Lentisphaeria bacterium]